MTEPKLAGEGRIWKRVRSGIWFVAIMTTVGIAGAEPLLGFPLALILISLSIVLG